SVRASGRVDALRLDRAVFSALTRSHPEVRAMFEALAKQRTLWNFLRVHSSFSQLPKEALALLTSELERVEFAAGELVIRQDEPPGPVVVIEEGRVRRLPRGGDGGGGLGCLRTGGFLRARSLFRY